VIRPYVAAWSQSIGIAEKSALRLFEIAGALLVVGIGFALKSRPRQHEH
jgi:hypothetical protein